ncbi:hypothetical protein [Faecalibaculum rodentium]|uniref:hypothetical protein n=2 Tax=Faecalibaculum rodentium TaxID=1702221 RepID=UPI0025B77504|nr:hypothetical protein [Faecalibaculum rodentium]
MAQKIINLEDLKYYDGKRRTQITEEITNATKGKVDKVEGKGLSTNDLTDELLEKLQNSNNYTHPTHTAAEQGLYKVKVDALGHVTQTAAVTKADITGLGIPAQDTTYEDATQTVAGLMGTEDKKKLDNIEAGAQANVIESVKVNGTALEVAADKSVNVAVPTKVSQLTNDSGFQNADEVDEAITGKGYQTAAQVETAITGKGYQTAAQVESAINTKIGAINHFEVVDTLPATGEKNVIYLTPKASAQTRNAKDEWIYVDGAFEKIGDTEIDLSNYWTKTDLTVASYADIDTIFAA